MRKQSKLQTLKLITFSFLTVLMASCGTKVPEATNSMAFRPLGATGLEVSEISIGCGAFGKMDTAQSRAFMDVALDSGINYIDIYDADPVVRGNIGYALQGRRDKMIIQGHIGCWWNGSSYERTRDIEKCQKGFNDLLQALGTDHIEVGMIHIVDNPDEWDTLMQSPYIEYVKQLKSEGKIQHIGLSSHNAEAALKAAKSGLVEVIMFSLNPAFDRLTSDISAWDPDADKKMLPGIDPVRVELYDYCAQHNIAITAMKAFGSGGGKLLDAERSPLHITLTVNQCLAYALAKPCVATVVCGANNCDELLADLDYLHATDADKDYNTALNGSGAKVGKGDCTYCNHCAPCPQGIPIAQVNELLDKAQSAKSAGNPIPQEVQQAYDKLPHHAGECTHCGSCVTRCPFDVDVPTRMDEAKQVFGK